MPRVNAVDRRKFTNVKLSKETQQHINKLQDELILQPDKINYAILKYEITKSVNYLIYNDIDLLKYQEEDLDNMALDCTLSLIKTVASLLFQQRKGFKSTYSIAARIQVIYEIRKYDRISSWEYRNVSEKRYSLSKLIDLDSYTLQKDKLSRLSYFSEVESLLKEHIFSSDIKLKLFASLVLNSTSVGGITGDPFTQEVALSLSKETKEEFSLYKKMILQKMNIGFENWKEDVVDGSIEEF